MNRFQLEKLYEINGLKDYKLKTPDDLLKTHGIDYRKVDGYGRLDDLNKKLYEQFIVNYFNGQGLDSRATMFPKGIYYVEEIEYIAKKHPEDEYFIVVGGLVKAIDRNGLKTVLHSWNDEDYKDLEFIESKPKTYLRFEYEHQGREEWQHVIDPKTWY